MKFRPSILLLLFVVSLGILAWMYYTATNDRTRQQQSPWREVLLDLREYARTKHVKSAQYAKFAEIAEQESAHNAARLFRAMALSEHIHEQNCIEALRRLGEEVPAEEEVTVFEGKTPENLARSVAFERQLHQDRHNESIDHAMQAGNRYAARILIWADGADIQHICLLEHCREEAARQSYAVCPECGNIYPADLATRYCPFCLTSGVEFIILK